jgi:hypothetical protein
MAGSFSDFLELELLDHVFGNASYSAPANTHIALFTATPSDSGGGTEVTGGSYVRLQVTNNATNWPAAASGAKANGTEFTFVTATANWGTIVAFGIFDASTSGNLLAWGDVTPNKAINNGDTAKFAVGDLDITLD